MKREEKNLLSRQRIIEAAMEEFSLHGYEGASLNTVCSEKGISKGMIYHYFRDRDELYLLCLEQCFNEITEHLSNVSKDLSGTVKERLQYYFDARLSFFAENTVYLGIFTRTLFKPPAHLISEITEIRRAFDEHTNCVLSEMLQLEPLREGLSINKVVDDFRVYMDFFNIHFRKEMTSQDTFPDKLKEHKERCNRQLDILLYGVLDERK